MTETDILSLSRQAMMTALQISLPVLLFGLIAGVVISILQAVTQIQEMTLTYIPKMLAVILALVIFGPWMINVMVSFTKDCFTRVPPVTSK